MSVGNDIIETIDNICKNELENLEEFLDYNEDKSKRFRNTVKKFYDFIRKTEDSSENLNLDTLPELIVNDVDNEQIYQQLQLHNNCAYNSLLKYFSKCLMQADKLTFGVNIVDKEQEEKKKSEASKKKLRERQSAEYESTDEDEDYGRGKKKGLNGKHSRDKDNDDDSDAAIVEEFIDKKESVGEDNNKKPVFGIPDGSDSEISDFEVEENGEDDDDNEEGEDEEAEDDEEGLDDEENIDDDDDDDEGLETKKKSTKLTSADDLDNLEEDEDIDDEMDLIDMYKDLGDEKEVLEIGKNKQEENENEKESKNKKKDDKKKVQFKDLFANNDDDDNADNENEEDGEKKSTFEKRQSKLKERIEKIHESMLEDLNDKPWQLKGEVTAKTRPQDSLLEDYLQFDHTTRQAPVLSQDFNMKLENIIKQRIKDKAFDDVERKLKPVEVNYEYKKQVVLDHQKSKMSLSQVYEQEYLNKVSDDVNTANNGSLLDKDPNEDKDKNPKHEEIRKMLQDLFIKLDALSNFHYTPRAPEPELKVVSNMPTIAVEEVAPVTVSDTNLLAPEEIHNKINSLPIAKEEESKKDKNRKLRQKKLAIKKTKEKKEKLLKIKQANNPDDAKVNKQVIMEKLKKQSKNMSNNLKILKKDKKSKVDSSLKSSSAFFKQLNDTNTIGKSKKHKTVDKNKEKSSKKLKL